MRVTWWVELTELMSSWRDNTEATSKQSNDDTFWKKCYVLDLQYLILIVIKVKTFVQYITHFARICF